MIENIPVAGLILAGGRARRMGGTDKGLLSLAGQTLVQHVLARLVPQVDSIFISANRNVAQYAKLGYPVRQDSVAEFPGPLAGILAGMESCNRRWLVVVPCDAPLLPADLVVRFRRAIARTSAQVAVAHDGQRMQSVMAMIDCSLADDLHSYLAAGERRVEGWFARQSQVQVDFSDCPNAFFNVNSPADLDELQLRLATTAIEASPIGVETKPHASPKNDLNG
jgi:molybdenum cofactor guanylyltransferase